MFHIRWYKIDNHYHGTEHGASTTKNTIDFLQSLLKVTRENSYNGSGKFKGIYVIGSTFRHKILPFSPEAWKINTDLTMYLMK